MSYKVFAVAYVGEKDVSAVAISAATGRAANARLRGHRPVDEILSTEVIPGRRPEANQDRIEGTVDLRTPLSPPPQAGTKAAEEIRAANRAVLIERYPHVKKLVTPWLNTPS